MPFFTSDTTQLRLEPNDRNIEWVKTWQKTCTQNSVLMNYTDSYKILIKICDDKYVQSQFMQDRICIAVMTTTKPLDKSVWRICLNAELAHIIWGSIDVHMRWLKLFILWLLHTNEMTKYTDNELENYAALRPSCRACMWQSIIDRDWPQLLYTGK